MQTTPKANNILGHVFALLGAHEGSSLYYSNNWVLSNNVWQTLMEALKTGDVSIQ